MECENLQELSTSQGVRRIYLSEAWEGRLQEEPKGTFSFFEAICRLGLNMDGGSKRHCE